jgi:type IV fimbrial biogenesis protein FimT
MLNLRHRQYGFTLVELMIAVVIFAILVALAIPSYKDWIQNQQIRAAAESVLNGIQLARATAVNNNGAARFVLCKLPASSWEVRAASSAAAANATASPVCGTTVPAGEYRVQERSGNEGSGAAQVAVNGAAIGVNTVTEVTFNSLGRVPSTGNADGTAILVSAQVSTPQGTHPLRVTVNNPSGNTRMCDPSATLAATDPRHC